VAGLLPFGVQHEKEFSEDAHMKAPGGILMSLWGLSLSSFPMRFFKNLLT
jgi:hypothetical protein